MRSDAQKEADLKYRQSEKGKIANTRHKQSEKCKATSIRYNQSKKGKVNNRHYRQSRKGKAADLRHAQTKKGKLTIARKKARRRELGFEMINDWFPGSHGHHIDKENVLFIPSELHRSIPHFQNDLESMKEINDAAFEWFYIKEVI